MLRKMPWDTDAHVGASALLSKHSRLASSSGGAEGGSALPCSDSAAERAWRLHNGPRARPGAARSPERGS